MIARCAGTMFGPIRSDIATADLRQPGILVATGFGVGLLPGAPGTYGSLLGALVWWGALANAAPVVQFASAGLLIAAATWLLHRVCSRHRLGDDPAIVLDEVAGVWLVLAFVPSGALVMAAGFLLFRLFDIVKPWPVSWADRNIQGGLGVMLDDVVAGILVLLTMHAALWLLQLAGIAVTA